MNQAASQRVPVVATIDKLRKGTYRLRVTRYNETWCQKKGSIADLACGLWDNRFLLPETDEFRLSSDYKPPDYRVIDEVKGTGRADIWKPFKQIYEKAAEQARKARESSERERASLLDRLATPAEPPTEKTHEVVLHFNPASYAEDQGYAIGRISQGLRNQGMDVGRATGYRGGLSFSVTGTQDTEDLISAIESICDDLGTYETPIRLNVQPRG